jgi:hypothetical protein
VEEQLFLFSLKGKKNTNDLYVGRRNNKENIGEEDNGVQVISDAVNVEDLRFYVTGAEEPYKNLAYL